MYPWQGDEFNMQELMAPIEALKEGDVTAGTEEGTGPEVDTLAQNDPSGLN